MGPLQLGGGGGGVARQREGEGEGELGEVREQGGRVGRAQQPAAVSAGKIYFNNFMLLRVKLAEE